MVDTDEPEAVAAHRRAMRLINKGRMAAAEPWLERAADDRQFMPAVVDLGVLRFRQNNLPAAGELWLRAAHGGSLRGAHALGVLLARQDRKREAEIWLRRALAAGADRAAVDLALLLREQGDPSELEPALARASAAGVAEADTLLGLLWHERGDVTQAEQWWRHSAASNRDAAYNLGLLLTDLGRYDEALEALREASRLNHPDAARAVTWTEYIKDGVSGQSEENPLPGRKR
jgi:tetratricopeptide (TPR) repeat protein